MSVDNAFGLAPSNGCHSARPDSSVSVGFGKVRGLKRELLAEFREGLEEGRGQRPEDLLPRWPADPRADEDFASVLFEDYQHRLRRGDKPSVDEYKERFPGQENSLAGLISRHQFLASLNGTGPSNGPALGLPDVGDEVFGFRLRHELGRGAFARVFLAEQGDLAGRPVVLKISGAEGDEPYTLAQLQHTNVVPIYSVHDDARAGLRALCMPYFGGASLSHVLRQLWSAPGTPVQGRQLVAALQVVQAPTPEAVKQPPDPLHSALGTRHSPGQTPLAVLDRLSYAGAAAWLVARLAEGLQHAHQRGVLHRDIKPSNILLGADGQPMLLDFNLAQNVQGDQAKAEATLGGTVAYMAPEHLRALANPSPAAARRVDHRSDIYSLGMVLFEMLTGHSPFDQSASYSVLPVVIEAMAVERSRGAPSVRKQRPTTPWGLESITRRCLAPDPEGRYQSAEELAEDLRRFLEDRPLRFAPELSQAERVRKWVRRHPRLTSSASVGTVAALLLVAAGAALAGVRGHLADAHRELEANQDRDRVRSYEAGTERALCLVNTVTDLQDNLRLGLRVCEETLDLYEARFRPDWQDDPRWGRLRADDRLRLAEDTRELLLLLAWGRVRDAAAGDKEVLRLALDLLDRADGVRDLKPSKAVWMDRARYLRGLGETARADEAQRTADRIEPASARDHYLLATAYARKGDVASITRAVAELNRAVRLNHRHYWSWVQRGICHQELGEYDLAASDFGTCIGLWPEFAWGYFNKGYALDQAGKKADALEAYSAALDRDPNFLLALVNRGLVRLQMKQHAEALADFGRAKELGRDDAFLHTGRGVALEGLGRTAAADEAFRRAFALADAAPAAVRTRIRWVYGFAVSTRLPDQARRVFDEVLGEDPNQPQALYGLGMLAVEAGKLDEGVCFFDRALGASPDFVDARRGRAVLRARQGRFDLAMQDINWCLEKEPRGGETLYAAACVAARAVEKTRDPSAADQALDFLQKAFVRGHGKDKAAQDPDLAALRKHPQFIRLIEGN